MAGFSLETQEVTEYELRKMTRKILMGKNTEGRIDFVLSLISEIDPSIGLEEMANYLQLADQITN